MEFLWAIAIVAGIGLVAGAILAVASVLMAVPVDEKAEKIRQALPGANCGYCGFAGCDDYAAAIAAGKTDPGLCSPGGEQTAKSLSDILGLEVSAQKHVAFVACGGSCEATETKMLYNGMQSCAAANLLYGGPSSCTFGCIGLGDCIKACSFNAISVINGTAVIDKALCEGCRKCTTVCPKGIIKIIPHGKTMQVACSGTDKGAVTRKICKSGCIGCKKCEKECEVSAIHIENNLAVIDPLLCTGCGKCITVCPQNCIK